MLQVQSKAERQFSAAETERPKRTMAKTPDLDGSPNETRAASSGAGENSDPVSQTSEAPKAADTSSDTDAENPQATPAGKVNRRHKKRHHAHRFGLWFFSMLIFLSLLAGLAILALTGQDIVLPTPLTKHIERQINRDLGDAKVSVGQIIVSVDKNFVPRAHAHNVGIIDPSGSEIARLNELQAQFSFDQLKSGQLTPQKLRLSGAQIVVRRRADGSFALDFGGASGTVGSAEDVLKAIDTAFSTDPFRDVQTVEARGLTISLEDARSNRIWLATDASITLTNSPQDINISMDFDVFNGTEDLARLQLGFATQKGSLETTVALNVHNAPALDMAQQSPALSFLSVLDAPISAAMRAQVNASGLLSSYSGTLEIGAGQLVAGEGATPLNFDGAKGYFDYDPVAERLSFPEISLRSDTFDVAGRGHLLLRDFDGNFPTNFIGQFDIDRFSADPKDIFTQPVEFDEGALDLQLTLDPFSVQLGQMALRRGDLWVRGSGGAKATPDGWSMSLDAAVDSMQVADLMSFWPESVSPKTRVWLDTNITAGVYNDVGVSVRLAPGAQTPQTHLGWNFEDAEVRFMKTLPPVTAGAGYGTIAGNTLTVVVQEGVISAPSGGYIDVAGTVLRIPQLNIKPATLGVQLETSSNVEAALSLMAQKPFDVLKEAAFGADVAQGRAQLAGQLSIPLIKKIQLSDVDFNITGDITEASSDQLLAGKNLRAPHMLLALDPTGLSLSGVVDVEGARASAVWRKAFGPEHRGVSNIAGSVTINQTLLDVFQIDLPKGTVSGAAQGDLDVALRKGKDPAFTITSEMDGLGLSVPSIGFSKAQQRTGLFKVSGTAGLVPAVSSLSIEAPGLSAQQGSVTLTSAGALDRLRFETFKVGTWLDSSVTLVGRGAGTPVAVRLGGGTLNLSTSPLGNTSGSSGASGPVELVLDRLIITDSIALHGVSASLTQNGGTSGQFSGRLNGSAPITGSVRPGEFGPVISVQAKDAGKAVVAMGLLEKATGGTLAMTLKSRREDKSYDGAARIENMKVLSAPKLAELLSLVSVVGLLEQLSGPGINFAEIVSGFTIQPERITIASASAEGPSLGITANGIYEIASKQIDLQGVISPIYFLNGIGQIVSRKGEGLFGFNFTLNGAVSNPSIGVNPLSILTPGALRGIFRKKPRAVTPQ
ncbi:YhdP family protein [Pacificibacter marinus]|uniref:YhdP central domain-containing protein n=1 Tax=Pacificibacter marinus TaxID=658057 RepID=A0A1Y5RLM6_9RHOB|nr:DUF3971 domain-containing protein [Pacificibacter marinus]SEK17621.1 AsmA-like C-terminal region [Pacificibacter marinus]SLN19965.1 hypothetical protein PAM7971_00593 [Pacificibacter marinus]